MFKQAIVCVAALVFAASTLAFSQLEYLRTGLGGNLQISNDGGATFESCFSGELYLARCDDPTVNEFWGFCTSSSVHMMMSGCWAADVTDTNSLAPSGGQVGHLTNAFALPLHASSDNLGAEMLQLAIWELTSESSGHFDLNAGSFRARNGDGTPLSGAQLALANGYLSDTRVGAAIWYRAQSDDAGHKLSQDIVTPTPEPSVVGAFAVGIVGLILRPRRRS